MKPAKPAPLNEGATLRPDADPPEPTLQPTADQVRLAAATTMLNPSALFRTISYALKFLDRELAEHPEDQMMAQAETDDVYGILVEIAAALHGLDQNTQPTPEQMEATHYWMLTQYPQKP